MAEAAQIGTVIVRWPAAIAPDISSDLRHREISHLEGLGVQVSCSWVPLAHSGESR
ncbi:MULTISPECIES: hypothetical protein [unclassified Streptomyces]|uniref:hypothetical protein n=1 Tax=unclassified Streptomyces TaxID=2593676 RepID=UPI0027409C0C|nr:MULTISPECIES: hypothetical protein [unclassified Streptomyces]